ncbi:phage holin family protein [Actinomadura algeriensis]|uniref:Membrane protein YqjE n=1 Tax=Actinomadura algeriensis TaxID=1679523 RepID=A0ABR9K0R0_9ACTN|nr:phage holin family protein [Actinomadura algeriensis]MBE1536417.1 putative membrane protein YqjE [Actinomadura algeriensis]
MTIMRPAQDGRGGATGATVHGDGQGTRHETVHDEAGLRETAPREGGRAEPGHHEPGTGELVRQATQQVSDLMRAELRLAVAELKDKGRHAGTGAGMFGGAGLVALYGIGALLTAAIAAIALVLPVWAAALIVGGVLLLVAGLLALMGRGQARRATPAKPERAAQEARQTVAELKERAHR